MCEDSPAQADVQLLANARNRAILSILEAAEDSYHVEELADRLVARDVAVVESATYEHRVEDVLRSLHHDRLPRLDDAGLIEYDRDANVATNRRSSEDRPAWQEQSFADALVSYLPPTRAAEGDDVGVLSGRQAAVEYGRQLADDADDELFCLYVSPDLLGEECLRRGQAAIDRGVSMYLGSGNAEVRELTRKHLPGATIWEPQLDWMNTPTYPRVGRLVLADRRRVMLAILEAPASHDDSPLERTLVGDGEDHPLVVLVRELLGARLDHLDFQSADFTDKLPANDD